MSTSEEESSYSYDSVSGTGAQSELEQVLATDIQTLWAGNERIKVRLAYSPDLAFVARLANAISRDYHVRVEKVLRRHLKAHSKETLAFAGYSLFKLAAKKSTRSFQHMLSHCSRAVAFSTEVLYRVTGFGCLVETFADKCIKTETDAVEFVETVLNRVARLIEKERVREATMPTVRTNKKINRVLNRVLKVARSVFPDSRIVTDAFLDLALVRIARPPFNKSRLDECWLYRAQFKHSKRAANILGRVVARIDSIEQLDKFAGGLLAVPGLGNTGLAFVAGLLTVPKAISKSYKFTLSFQVLDNYFTGEYAFNIRHAHKAFPGALLVYHKSTRALFSAAVLVDIYLKSHGKVIYSWYIARTTPSEAAHAVEQISKAKKGLKKTQRIARWWILTAIKQRAGATSGPSR
jgi:hypothetical protein